MNKKLSKQVMEFIIILHDIHKDDDEKMDAVAESIATRFPENRLYDINVEDNTLRVLVSRTSENKQHLDDLMGDYLDTFKTITYGVMVLNVRASVSYNPHTIGLIPT
jgi:transcription termination factor NusB